MAKLKYMIFMFLVISIVIASGALAAYSTFTVKTSAKDYNTEQFIKPCDIDLGGIKAVGNPNANFAVSADRAYAVTHSADNYKSDKDYFFLDSDLDTCDIQQATCSLTGNDDHNHNYVTSCNYNAAVKHWECKVVNNDKTERFEYAPDQGAVVYVTNFLVPLTGEETDEQTDEQTDDQTEEDTQEPTDDAQTSVPAITQFTVKTSAKDYNTEAFIKPVTVDLGGIVKTGTPNANFVVNANRAYAVEHSAEGYHKDKDYFFLDGNLNVCDIEKSTCTLSGQNEHNNQFDTTCNYNAAVKHWECEVINNGKTERFEYAPDQEGAVVYVTNFLVSIDPDNQRPEVTATAGPLEGDAPLEVSFNGQVTDDTLIEAVIIYYGDGESEEFTPNSASYNFDKSHYYTKAGTHLLQIVAFDDQGLAGVAEFNVVVTGEDAINTRPVADAGNDKEAVVDVLFKLDGTGSYDPNPFDPMLTYEWTFEDGPETVTMNNVDQARASFTPERTGEYVFKLTVSDGELTSSDTVTITAVDSAKRDLFVGRIKTNDNQVYFKPGDKVDVSVNFAKERAKDIDQAVLHIIAPKLGFVEEMGPFEIDDDDMLTKEVVLKIPEKTMPGTYEMRIIISTGTDQRVKIRRIKVI